MQAKKSYHHGDLAQTLISAAINLIALKGPSALSLREVARAAGVSHAAPAHHFGDKSGLLTAIAVKGLRELTEALQAAGEAKPAKDPARLIGSGEAYIRFSLDHPAYFAVMFRPDLILANDPGYQTASQQPGAVLTQFIEESLEASGKTLHPDIVSATAIALWSQVHGFASLWSTSNLGDQEDKDLLSDTMTRMFNAIQLPWLLPD
ncbi:MAG: AcrR family transcriptional regulator [Candidatus Azotimanducaceae bacterium]|jgi:AcrR family transcriptional regulator